VKLNLPFQILIYIFTCFLLYIAAFH